MRDTSLNHITESLLDSANHYIPKESFDESDPIHDNSSIHAKLIPGIDEDDNVEAPFKEYALASNNKSLTVFLLVNTMIGIVELSLRISYLNSFCDCDSFRFRNFESTVCFSQSRNYWWCYWLYHCWTYDLVWTQSIGISRLKE